MNPNHKLISDITKEYRDMFKVIQYRNPLVINKEIDRTPRDTRIAPSEDNVQRSIRRTKSVIKDYVLNNDFDLFVTFTFDPRKVDRYDFSACSLKMQGYINRLSRYAKANNINFRYIVVPEFHKDGAIHFHALIGDFPKALKKTKVLQNNRRVYNIPGYRFGFTNAQKITTADKSSIGDLFGYLTKYITKDMPLIFGRRRYWCSRNLAKPIIYHNQSLFLGLVNKLTPENQEYENAYATIYKIPKFE